MSYVMVDVLSLAELELTASEARVLNVMMAHMDRGTNEVRLTVGLIADKVGCAQSAASRTLSALVARDIVQKRQLGLWRVTPRLAYSGDWKDWDAAAREVPEPKWSRHEDAH